MANKNLKNQIRHDILDSGLMIENEGNICLSESDVIQNFPLIHDDEIHLCCIIYNNLY